MIDFKEKSLLAKSVFQKALEKAAELVRTTPVLGEYGYSEVSADAVELANKILKIKNPYAD